MSDLLPALEHAETLASLPVKLNFDKLRITSTLENYPDQISAGRAEYLSALRHGVVELIKLESKCGGETIQFLPGSVPLLNMARAILGLTYEKIKLFIGEGPLTERGPSAALAPTLMS